MNKELGVDIMIADTGWLDGAGEVISRNGDMQPISDADNVRQALIMRLNCPKGTLIRHQEYGNGVYDILSESMSDSFLEMALANIKDCIVQEPRAELVDVTYTVNHAERTIIYTVYYKVVDNPGTNNLVYTLDVGG